MTRTELLDHAGNGQTQVIGAGTYTGLFSGFKVSVAATVAAMTWADSYGEKCSDGKTWADLPSGLSAGYWPGLFTEIEISVGEGILIHA